MIKKNVAKNPILFNMKFTPMLIYFGFFIQLHTTFAGRCTGSASCKACTSCNSCSYCLMKGSTCGVCNPIEEKDKPSNQNPLTYYLLGAGSLGGGLLVYKKIKTKK
jgi:hypothetical protein